MVTKRLIKGIVKGLLMEMVGDVMERGLAAQRELGEYIKELYGSNRAMDIDPRLGVCVAVDMLRFNPEKEQSHPIFEKVKQVLIDYELLDRTRETEAVLFRIIDGFMDRNDRVDNRDFDEIYEEWK